MLTNDLELTRLYESHSLKLLYWQTYCGFAWLRYLVPFNILARSGTG